MKSKTVPKCCSELLKNFRAKFFESRILEFSGVGESDVYNISQPFEIGNKTVLAGRVEQRGVWADSEVVFFEEDNRVWKPVSGAPVLKLEDAFSTNLGDEYVLGGVEVYTENNEFNATNIGYRTVFYRGKCLSSLKKFAAGPDRMKDIRLVKLKNGKIGVCTRPQGGEYAKGKIGSMEIEHIGEITPENMMAAKIIDDLFAENEWGGANELHVLDDGRIGVLGHLAYEDKQHFKHYYAMTFIYDPKTHRASDIEILATRKEFPKGESKKPELEDVVFPGGLVRHQDGTATLYAGLSDAQAGCITLTDPFWNLMG